MNLLGRSLPLLAVLTVPAFADQVVLTNGDRITGKVVKKDGGTLSVKTDLMGDVTVKWEHVASLETAEPVTVVVPDGETVKGKVATVAGQVEVGGKQVPLAKVDAIRDAAEQARHERYLHPSLGQLWTGFADAGLATAQGNAKTLVFTSAFNATRTTRGDSTNLHFTQIYSRGLADGRVVDTAKAIRGGWTYNRNLKPRLFINTFNDYEYDAFQNLDLRVNLGGGLGWKFWHAEKGDFDVVGGGSFVRDKFSTPLAPRRPGAAPEFDRHAGEAFVGDDLSYKLGPRSALKQTFRMFNNLTSTGEYRINFDLGTDTRLARWLSWQITASDRYLSNPVPGRKTNDLLISSGIRVTFSR